ncbi:short-chain dehydrogenase [Zhengella mangrovi]|uniref:Short-chain dehydrogenase n=1 Tax=Zhengella mangrovi TaxID=1982044 RepID=A0A2G1QIE4_9HYPH|nr:SDR family NAD(P)-dependent oxidoreductase [Zhengella mangrovi]PHP65224.1 short-chain dehydrogenase [Zhengella mangrovi]
MPGPLDGRRVLVTGAGSGIGRALAVEAARRGASLCLSGRRADALRETRTLLDPGQVHLVVPADITSEAGRAGITDSIGAAWGGLDILVNNAGVIAAGSLTAMPDETVLAMMSTNVTAPMFLTRDLVPLLERGRSPRIVNIGSMLGEIPLAHFAAYSASKAAVKGVSVAMRRELRARNIAVTYAAPRTTATDAAARLKAYVPEGKADSPERVARQIWRGVEQGRDHVYPSPAERLFMALQALAPRMVDRFVTPRTSTIVPGHARTIDPIPSEDASHV